MVPTDRYTQNNRWTARLNITEAVYLEPFDSRQLLISYMRQRIAGTKDWDGSMIPLSIALFVLFLITGQGIQ
jgi:hypothetical protein